jgi:catechol 2,3-dioxygenase-like lactoylglutathione lyase family enzyme
MTESQPDLGPGYIALNVADIEASLRFYAALGFEVFDGNADERWLMLRNGDNKLGLFQGMFETNILTFHPADARGIQARLQAMGLPIAQPAEPGDGPATVMLTDPDGNPVMLDQL